MPFGQARKCSEGSDVTLVAWGNAVEKSFEAIAKISDETSVELIDLRSIVPWDKAAIEESMRKTRRLVVVQEDTENCSVGQMIISHLTGDADLRAVDRLAQSLDVRIVDLAVDVVGMAVLAAVRKAVRGRIAAAGRSVVNHLGDQTQTPQRLRPQALALRSTALILLRPRQSGQP